MPPSGRNVDAAVLERRDLGRQQRHDLHLLVGGHEAFDDAGLDVFEDVRAEAVERVGLAVVARRPADRWRRPAAPAACRPAGPLVDEPPPHPPVATAAASTTAKCRRASSTRSPRPASAWRSAPPESRRSRARGRGSARSENAAPWRAAQRRRADRCSPRVPSQYITAVPGYMQFFTASARAAAGAMRARVCVEAGRLVGTSSRPCASDRSTTARAAMRTRVCCCAICSSGVRKPISSIRSHDVAGPALGQRAAREHGDAAGAVDRRHLSDPRTPPCRRASSARDVRWRRGAPRG